MKTSSILALTASLGLATAASAQVLMLDFGPAAATGDDRLNSPYHAVTPSFLQTGWNTIGVADVNSGLKFADGTNATNVSVNLGYSVTSTIDLTTNPGSGTQLTGSAINGGVYANTSPARDGIFQNTAGANLGVQISGLGAGTYEIYVVARNTNSGTTTNSGQTQTVLVGKQSGAGNFNFSDTLNPYTSGMLSYPVNQSTSLYTSSWVQGENYIKLSISLTAGELLNIAVDGNSVGASTDARAFLNSIQIVNTSSNIPEPSAFAALAGLAGLGFAASRRRRA